MHQHNRHHLHDHDHHRHDDHHHHDDNHDEGHSPHEHSAPPLAERLKHRWRWFAAAGILLLAYLTVFTVRETEFVLVTQFGRPLYTVSDAGLHAKWFFRTANYFDRRLHIYNPRPSEFLTRDKKNLVVENYVAWRVADPTRFVETVGDVGAAEMRLHDIVWSGLSATLGNHDLDAIVSVDAAARRVAPMMDELLQATDRAALAQYGIRVVDVRIKRLNLPEQNKQSVYARMRAERERIARQYRAEGEEQALRIRAEADRQREEIVSAAYKEAERIKGEGDAESARLYGAAYSKNPRFYKLLRTLESYKKILDDKTTAILSSDSELLRVLMRGEGGVQ
jgi:membrane protease subunit HflC